MNAEDAAREELAPDALVRIVGANGAFVARLVSGGDVPPGVVAGTKGWWASGVEGRANVNAAVAEGDSDMGGGALFSDNRVRVEQLSR